MIHAWVDRILNINEIHGPNFLSKMNEINKEENNFQISIRHNFPVERKALKYTGKCLNCGEKYMYRKRIRNIACKKCCNLFFNGSWNKKCLILFD
jgi:formylmethanofuran dehydrogenase subunit E|tara:strand:- start:287 stop:571 length:285 start_codon:yes stop_codon:yes gene_type:complete